LKSFAGHPHDIWSDFPLIEQAHRRLRKVVIENQDFEKLVGHYDRPGSFFYADPPYFETEGYYSNVGENGFTVADHIRLRDTLMRSEGKFLLSYNDCKFVRELYDSPNLTIMEVSRLNSMKQRFDGGCQFEEVLIANYDTSERGKQSIQLNFFGI
jgi:DNA adenine methylase